MSFLLGTAGTGGAKTGSAEWLVGGKKFSNSAVKFWSTVVEDADVEFPGSERLVLSSYSDRMLRRCDLNPNGMEAFDLCCLAGLDFAAEWQKTVEEMELTGMPAAVKLTLHGAGRLIVERMLEADCMDSEVFPFFAVWLLEWADVPESEWNTENVVGKFTSGDSYRGIEYWLDFTIASRHLSEGLYCRDVSVGWRLVRGCTAAS